MSGSQHLENLSFEASMQVVFDKNLSEKIEDVSINGLEDTADVFWFCVKVLKYGIVKVIGTSDIDAVSADQFKYIQDCMSRLGILVYYDIVSSTEFDTPFLKAQIAQHVENTGKRLGMTHFIERHQTEVLPAHKLFLFTPRAVYKVYFDLVRVDPM